MIPWKTSNESSPLEKMLREVTVPHRVLQVSYRWIFFALENLSRNEALSELASKIYRESINIFPIQVNDLGLP